MELQEILGCLGNVEKLNALPLSTLKAAAKKYPYISQLKELMIKKEITSEGLKDYLLSTTDHTPSTELKSALELNESDPSLLIRIVKKERNTAKQKGKKILNLKKDKINPLESKLTLVKPDSKKTKPVESTKPVKEEKEATSTQPVTRTKKDTVTAKSEIPRTAKKTSPRRSTRATQKKSNTISSKRKILTNVAPTPKKRAYVRKSDAAKLIQVSPINPPLPDWKDILSKVEIKTTASTRPKSPKAKTTKAIKSTRKSVPAKTVATKTSVPKKSTAVKKEVKNNTSTSTSASNLDKEVNTKKKVANKGNSKNKNKLSPKKKSPISSKKARLKFSEWLSEKSKKTKAKTKKKASKTKPKNALKRLVKSSVVKKEEIATVTLAKLYSKQGHNKKAIKVYERLRLLNPEKSSFFASKIRKLKQK